MKPAPFNYFTPATLDEALALLAEHGADAKPLAGGQSLIPAMNFRLARPAALVDLNRIGELSYIRSERDGRGGGATAIGAMTRQRTAERSAVVARAAPLLAEAMPSIAHPQIRHRGTLGGRNAHADPSGQFAAGAVGPRRRVPCKEPPGRALAPRGRFFQGPARAGARAGRAAWQNRGPAAPPPEWDGVPRTGAPPRRLCAGRGRGRGDARRAGSLHGGPDHLP